MEHLIPRRRLSRDSRVGNHNICSGVHSYYDSVDIDGGGYALTVTVLGCNWHCDRERRMLSWHILSRMIPCHGSALIGGEHASLHHTLKLNAMHVATLKRRDISQADRIKELAMDKAVFLTNVTE